MGDLEIYDEYTPERNAHNFFKNMYATVKHERELKRVPCIKVNTYTSSSLTMNNLNIERNV